MGTGGLKNELQRRIEIATSSRSPRNGDDASAQRLAESLNTGIQDYSIRAVCIHDTSQDLVVAVGDRIRDLHHRPGIGIPQNDPQKDGALGRGRRRAARGSLGFRVGVQSGHQGRGNEYRLAIRHFHGGAHDLDKVVRGHGYGSAAEYIVAGHGERIPDIGIATAGAADRRADGRRGFGTRSLSKSQTCHQQREYYDFCQCARERSACRKQSFHELLQFWWGLPRERIEKWLKRTVSQVWQKHMSRKVLVGS